LGRSFVEVVMKRGLVLLMAVVMVGAAACSQGDEDDESSGGKATSSSASSTSTTAPSTSSTSSTSSTTTAPPSTTTTASTVPPGPPQPGASGPDVQALQRRLEELHYWVGPTDGRYGELTKQAVYAFQKVNGLPVDGKVGPATQAKLDHPVAPPHQSTSGVVWEVDKARQVLMVVRDGQVLWIWNTSTGTEKPYVHEGVRHMADTPVGHLTFTREIDGWRKAPLGMIYRPKYFHPDGIAIHGYSHVPPYPASHGCVRLTNPAMDAVWATGLATVGTPIWVYGQSPV